MTQAELDALAHIERLTAALATALQRAETAHAADTAVARELERAAISTTARNTNMVWQPIETAPRDKTRVLVRTPQQWFEGLPFVEIGIGWYSDGWLIEGRPETCTPTHWAPLPSWEDEQ